MKKNNPYIILLRATISYMWKMHPYMMIWFTSGIFAGVYTAITEMKAERLIAGIVFGLTPVLIKKIWMMLRSMESRGRIEISRYKEYRREEYKKYVKEYAEKLTKK